MNYIIFKQESKTQFFAID